MENLYFRRIARFDLVDERVVVFDAKQPRVITLDAWPELVFQMADGEHTIQQMIEHLGEQYEDGVPVGLSDQIIATVKQLIDEGILELASGSQVLPSYLSIPVSEQNPEKEKAAMIRDGFIKP